MSKSINNKRSANSSYAGSMIESLESRQLLSVSSDGLSPSALKPPPAVVQISGSPKKILAGSKPAYEVVTIHNYTTAAETETVTISLVPSTDGVNTVGEYSTPSVTETLTIKKHGAAGVKVPFVPPITLAAGKYHTIAIVDIGEVEYTAVTPNTYTLTLPPLPTTTPSLVHHYFGLITATNSQSTGFFGGGTTTTIHQATFNWMPTSQDLTSLTGIFGVGERQDAGSMQGYELSNGILHYTFASADINYTIDAKVSADGTKITGKFKGTLINNIFKSLGGTFKLTIQTP